MGRMYHSHFLLFIHWLSYRSNNITSNTTRIPGANPIRCDTEEEAKCVFDAALDAGMVEMADVVITRAKMTQNEFPVNTYRLTQ